MFEVLWNRKPAAKTLRNIVPQGLNSLNSMSVLENAVYPLNREDIQLGKICRKSEKKFPTLQEKLHSWNWCSQSSVWPWQVLFTKGNMFCVSARITAHTDITLLFLFFSIPACYSPTVPYSRAWLPYFARFHGQWKLHAYYKIFQCFWFVLELSRLLILDPQEVSVLLPKKHLTYCKCTLCLFWKCNMDISGISKLLSVSA